MENKYDGLHGRDILVNELKCKIIKNNDSFSIAIIGDYGCGKKYVIDSLVNNLETIKGIQILRIIGDEIIDINKRLKTYSVQKTVGFSWFLAFSLTYSKDNNTYMKYIINYFKKIKSKTILIVGPDFENSQSHIRKFIHILVKNKKYIEKSTKKNINIIISLFNEKYKLDNISCIYMNSYQKKDIDNYIKGFLYKSNSIANIDEYDMKLNSLYFLTNANLDLVNIIYQQVFDNTVDKNNTLLDLVKNRFVLLQKHGEKENIDQNITEEIILTSSLYVDYFDDYLLEEITKKDLDIIDRTLYLALKEKIYYKPSRAYYDFTSKKMKNILFDFALEKNHSKIVKIYNYLTEYYPENYFLRAYYLSLHYNKIDSNVFSLLILALSKSFLFDDFWIINKIRFILKEYNANDDYFIDFENFVYAYESYYKKMYKESNDFLKNINYSKFTYLLKTEYHRMVFRNYYSLSDYDNIFRKSLNFLKKCINNELQLKLDHIFLNNDESTLKLRVIYELAPYTLDDDNNYSEFANFYTLSQNIYKTIRQNNNCITVAEYITNVFNRKAFLYASPVAAIAYYDEAISFFEKYKIWDELAITYICLAGTLIACGEFQESLDYSKNAEKIIAEYNIDIPDIQKMKNNEIIAEFMLFESNHQDTKLIMDKANKTIEELENIIETIHTVGATKNVILTNLASLYLYINNCQMYKLTKNKIEKSLKCIDVSDIDDKSINDFYRYHFALNEIYYFILQEKWEKSDSILKKIDNFVPSLFIKQEVYWTQKNSAIQNLIYNKNKMNGYEYCNNLVKIKQREEYPARFFLRGLMLSDLQFTSFD